MRIRSLQNYDALYEFPMSCLEMFGKRLPLAAGVFSTVPYSYTKLCMRRCMHWVASAVFYLHPWELDPGQPRIKLPVLKRSALLQFRPNRKEIGQATG